MNVNKKSRRRAWIGADDAPDSPKPKWRAKMDAARVKRGRPKLDVTKVSTTIRLDADVLDALKKDGAGWQTRANGILRAKLLSKPKHEKRA